MKQVTLLCFCALVCTFSVGVSAAKIKEVQDGPTHIEKALDAVPVRKQMEMIVDDSGMYKQEEDINPDMEESPQRSMNPGPEERQFPQVIDDSGMYKQEEDINPDMEKLDPPQRSMIPRSEERQIRPVINAITDRESMVQSEYQRRGDKNGMALVNNRGPVKDQRYQSQGYIPSGYGPPGSNKPRFTPNGPNHWPENRKRHCKKHRHHRHHHHHHHGDENEDENKEEESLIFSKNCPPQNKVVIISDELEHNEKQMDNECKETCISRPNRDVYDILNTDLNVNDSLVIIAGASSYPHNISSILNRINDFVQISTRTNIFISTIPIKEDESDDSLKNYIKRVNEWTRNTLTNYPSIQLLDLETIHRDLMKFSPEDWGKFQICTWINDNVKPRGSVYGQSTTTDKFPMIFHSNEHNAAEEKLSLAQRVPDNNEVPYDISIIFSMGSSFDEDINNMTDEKSMPLMTSNFSVMIPNQKADLNLSPYSIKNPWFYNRENWKNSGTGSSLPSIQASETVRYEDADGNVVSDDNGTSELDTVIIPCETEIESFDDALQSISDTIKVINDEGWAIENQSDAQMNEDEALEVENSPEMVIFDV